jgi:hypothetical protein
MSPPNARPAASSHVISCDFSDNKRYVISLARETHPAKIRLLHNGYYRKLSACPQFCRSPPPFKTLIKLSSRPATQGPAHLARVRPGVHPDLRNSSTTLPYLHLATHKPRGPGSAAAAVVASLRLNHKAAIAPARPAVSAIAMVGRPSPALLPSCRLSPFADRRASYYLRKSFPGRCPGPAFAL